MPEYGLLFFSLLAVTTLRSDSVAVAVVPLFRSEAAKFSKCKTKRGKFLTVRKEVLCPECIFRQGNVSADGSIIEREHLILVLELIVSTKVLQNTRITYIIITDYENDFKFPVTVRITHPYGLCQLFRQRLHAEEHNVKMVVVIGSGPGRRPVGLLGHDPLHEAIGTVREGRTVLANRTVDEPKVLKEQQLSVSIEAVQCFPPGFKKVFKI